MGNTLILKTALQGALSALESLSDAPSENEDILVQNDLIHKIQESLQNKKRIDTCEVTITNNCGIAMGIPHPMCIYTAYENGEFKTKTLYWEELLETPTIEVVKGAPLMFKDANFLGIAVTVSGSNKQEYTDGSLFCVYSITEDCKVDIYG